jgi:hypothetical protein
MNDGEYMELERDLRAIKDRLEAVHAWCAAADIEDAIRNLQAKLNEDVEDFLNALDPDWPPF